MKKLSIYSFGLAAMLSLGALSFTSCETEEEKAANPGATLEKDSEVMGGQAARENSFYSPKEKTTVSAGEVSNSSCARLPEIEVTAAETGSPATFKLMSYPERRNAANGFLTPPSCTSGGVATTFVLTTLTSAQFSNIETDGNADFVKGVSTAGGSAVVAISAQKVYAFNAGARKGLILVKTVTPGATVGVGTANLEFKFTK